MRFGPYELVGPLGRGGMGRVLEVRHPDLPGRRLALKLVRSAKSASAPARAVALRRFQREAQLLARVRHPGVVTVHATGESEHGPWIVMDLVEGRSLAELLGDGPLPRARAVELVLGVAEAVAAAHAAGVLHRDIKPSNVLVRADGRPVLIDFGLARAEDQERLTRTGSMIGSPHYMAPEQVNGSSPDDLDERVDVWALGTLLFELLEGRPPCGEGRSFAELLYRITELEPRWPDLPAGLLRPLQRALAKRRADRQPDARAFAAELRAGLREEAQALPLPRRRALVPAGAGLALLALLVGWLGMGPRPLPGPARAPQLAEVPSAAPPGAPSPGPAPQAPARAAAPGPDAAAVSWLRVEPPEAPERVAARLIEPDLLLSWTPPGEGIQPSTLGVWRLELPAQPRRLRGHPLPGPVASLDVQGQRALLVVLGPQLSLYLFEVSVQGGELHRLRVPLRQAPLTATALIPGGFALAYGPDAGEPASLVGYTLEGDAAREGWARPIRSPVAGLLSWGPEGLLVSGAAGGELVTAYWLELVGLEGQLLTSATCAHAGTATVRVGPGAAWRGDTSGLIQPLSLPGLRVGEALDGVASRSRLDMQGLVLAPSHSGLIRGVRSAPGVVVGLSTEREDTSEAARVLGERELRVWTPAPGGWTNAAALAGWPRPLHSLDLTPDGSWIVVGHGGAVELWRRTALPSLRGDEARLPRWADALSAARGAE